MKSVMHELLELESTYSEHHIPPTICSDLTGVGV